MSCLLENRRNATWAPILIVLLALCSVAAFGQFSTSTSAVSFGSVQVGSISSVPIPITNFSRSSLTISQVTVSGNEFSFSGPNLPITLAPQQSANVYVTFSPQSAGAATGSANILELGFNGRWQKQHTAGLTVSLSGTGVSGGYLTPSPASLNFGSMAVGSKQTQSVTVTNTGGSSVGITQAAVSGTGFSMSGFSPQVLAVGQSLTLNVGFSAASAGTASGTLSLSSTASDSNLSVALSGSGTSSGYLTPSPASVNFGSLTVGSSQTQSVTVTNTGGSSVSLTQAAVSGTGFTMSGFTPQTLAAGQSLTLSVGFTANSAGAASGALSLSSNATDSSLSVALSGTGTSSGYLTPSPANVNFGSIAVGSKQTQSVTVTNTGGSSVNVTQASVSGTGFSVSSVSPQTLAAGQSLTLSVGFTAASSGAASGTLILSSTATDNNLSLALSGTGVTAGYLTPSPANVNFGSIAVGSKQTQSVTVTNTGGSSVNVTQASVSGTGFSVSSVSPQTLAAGQSLTLSIGFTAASSGAASGTLILSSTATDNNLSLALSGTGVTAGYLTPSPAALNFGSISVGSSQTQPVTVTNTGGSSVNVTQAAVSGTGFTMSGFSPQTLAAGQSLTVSVGFTANSAGAASGALSLSSNATDSSLSVALSGSGTSATGQLTASPASVSFGTVSVGSSSSQSGVLSASGASVTVSSASSNSSQFTIGGLTLPVTIPSGQSVPFTVTFSPLVSGSASGSLSFVSNASTTTVGETLSGTGQAVQYNVALSWSPSTSTVTGYNVYRGTTSGGPYSKINSSVDAVTTYADGTVQSGQTYYYVTTAVASGGMESTYSNETAAQIP